MAAQDGTMSLSAAENAEELDLPFVDIAAIMCDHSYLPTRFGGLVDNALVYISGFVVQQVLRKLSCDVCRGSLVKDAIPTSFDESYHLFILKNKGWLMIPSDGTIMVLRAAERVVCQFQTGQALKVDTCCPGRHWHRGCVFPP